MPINPRVRANNVFGITLDNPLSAIATAFNSTGLVNLPAIATQHAVVVLDPLRVNGAPEIVVVTAHTALGSVATITRGAYGTTARSHPQGTMWMHTPVDEDYIEVLSSITRPTDPYEGQFIFETDTNKLIGYGGVDWAPRDAGGQLGYAQVVVNSSTFTAETDLVGLSVVVTVGTGRRIRIIGSVYLSSSVANDAFGVRIKEGATQLRESGTGVNLANAGMTVEVSTVITPSAGSHTYKIAGVRFAGTGNITSNASATNPAFILVEDIGAA